MSMQHRFSSIALLKRIKLLFPKQNHSYFFGIIAIITGCSISISDGDINGQSMCILQKYILRCGESRSSNCNDNAFGGPIKSWVSYERYQYQFEQRCKILSMLFEMFFI